MTDHLEPYRRMVRSIRFVPPLGRNHPSHHPVAEPIAPAPMSHVFPRTSISEGTITASAGPAPDPSQHVAALVQDAVSKPTVLPVSYTIPENIGDRISRLTKPRAESPVIIPPKIPQPDPNWAPPNTAAPQYVELDWHDLLEKSHTEASTANEVADSSVAEEMPPTVAETPTVEETPASLPQAEIEAPVAKSVTAAEIPPTVAENPAAEESQASLPQVKIDAPSVESATAAETPPTVAETPTTEESQASLLQVEIDAPSVESATAAETPPTVAETPTTEESQASLLQVEIDAPSVESATAAEIPPTVAETPTTEESQASLPQVEIDAPSVESATAAETPPTVAETPTVEESAEVELEDTTAQLPSTSASDRQTPDKQEQIQIKCPACESTELRKNGHRKDKQRYMCKDCGKQFVASEPLTETKDKPKAQMTSLVTTPEVKEPQSLSSVADKASNSSAHQTKAKKKAKGFGAKKSKK